MNRLKIASFQRLVEYDATAHEVTQPEKLTVSLDPVYQDLISRIAILHDYSKTDVIKHAITTLVDIIGEEILYLEDAPGEAQA
jgi:hypothetical protein